MHEPKKLKEGEKVAVEFDGYFFGDRLLEGVTFIAEVTLKDGKPVVVDVKPHPSAEKYMKQLNREMWVKRAEHYAQESVYELLE